MILLNRLIVFICNKIGVYMSIISYKNLFKLLIDKGIKKTELAKMADISQTTLAKLSKNQCVSMDVLVKICDSLDCSFDAIVEIIRIENNNENERGGETLEE
jgi:DNA-binding Xre family transcriptional regulator